MRYKIKWLIKNDFVFSDYALYKMTEHLDLVIDY